MNRKKISISKYLLVLVFTIIIFAAGIAVGSFSTNQKFNQVDQLEQDLRTQTMAIETQFLILAQNPCEFINSTPFTDELFETSEKLGYMEDVLGKKDPNVLRLKEYYSLLQIRHWLLMQTLNKECGENNILILYFYSNLGDCDKCEEQGYVLTYIRKNHEEIKVYPFDINLHNPALDAMQSVYLQGEKTTPAIVINGEIYKGFRDRAALETILANITRNP